MNQGVRGRGGYKFTEGSDENASVTDDEAPLFVIQLSVTSYLNHLPQQSNLTTKRKEICRVYTVEPLHNGHIGTDHFVHYREVVLFQR